MSGKILRDMADDNYRNATSVRQGKQLMRMLINHYLGSKPLHTRELVKGLQKT